MVADYFGAPYAVATDSCTHAIELCLRLKNFDNIKSPEYTYLSVPMTFSKLNLHWEWADIKWQENYTIPGTNIIDAATQWKENSYTPGSFTCVSFQNQKHLSLGRGGMILTDNKHDFKILSKMRYDGRDIMTPWREQNISCIGYHYYMTPETAQKGLDQFANACRKTPKIWNWHEYVYLPDLEVFKNVS